MLQFDALVFSFSRHTHTRDFIIFVLCPKAANNVCLERALQSVQLSYPLPSVLFFLFLFLIETAFLFSTGKAEIKSH